MFRPWEENGMQPDGYIELPTDGGPIELPVISLPASAFSDLQNDSCTWLVADMTGGIHDATPCEAPVSGRECAEGHPQVAGMSALNSRPAELS
jgi:hypothetical protein